ncbi:hypothetical protein BDV59DRAFT_190490 [Aspergillus ambiguus]|uniref:uncharacterized protein n=1 Tax=Aspergillus ambiguus TaxID=176160 RepID=UPI003CCDF79C
MSSSPTSSPSSTPTGASSACTFADPLPAGFRSHGNSDNATPSEAGPAFDKRSERRRSTLSGSDRKRRLVNTEGNIWSRRVVSGPVMQVGSSSRSEMDSRPISISSSDATPGSSYADPIDLSSSPPNPVVMQRPDNRRRSWTRPGNDYMEYTRPRWQPDSEVTNCPICATPFSFWYRKHHCRKCGRVVCASCSPHRITIPRQFIVQPPDPNQAHPAAVVGPRASRVINLEADDDAAQSPTALNPALGGGEEVRLCNPCVPDPNPEPPRGYGTSGLGVLRGSYAIPPGQTRHRSYHSMSSGSRPSPYAATDAFFQRPTRRTVGSNDFPNFGAFGGSYGSRYQERPIDYGAIPAPHFAPAAHSSARPLPQMAGSTPAFPNMGMEQSFRAPFDVGLGTRRRRVEERDLCPICDGRLPPLGENGSEDMREAHIRDCIESHGRQGRSPSRQRGSPVAQASVPVRMIAFAATEKDCLGQDGGAQECTICMEDYEVGQPLVRLECLCKFHKRCIVEWFERKKECPVHKPMDFDPRLRLERDTHRTNKSADAHNPYAAPTGMTAATPSSSSSSSSHPPPPPPPVGPRYPDPPASSSHFPNPEPPDPNDPYADLKRPRACEACRQLKVRCEPDLNNPSEPCKRCAKAHRACVVTAPTRKRQKKTDSRVAELERKIDALTASLQATSSASPQLQEPLSRDQLPLPPPPAPPRADQPPGPRWLGPTLPSGSTGAGSKRGPGGEVKESRDGAFLGPYERAATPASDQTHGGESASRQWRAGWGARSASRSESAANEAVDIVERGMVSEGTATRAFERYVTKMAPTIPMVVFPADTAAEQVRRTRPLLFHAIVCVAVGAIQPDLQAPLTEDFYKVVAERVIVRGEKTLELIQAILVTCNWYMVPDHFEELKFYQMTHLAVSIGIEIGMYRKASWRNKPFNFMRDVVHRKPLTPDPDSPEVRRSWLGCYFLAVQVTVALRRSILVRWHPYMDECIEILEKSPEALPSDKHLIQWAKLSHLMEEVNSQFFADDASDVSYFEPPMQYALRVFERQLEQWRKETRLEEQEHAPMLRQAEKIADLYMHEPAMHMESSTQDSKSASDPASTAQVNALSSFLVSCHRALDIVCGVDIHDLICFPVVFVARTSFAIVALIKMYSIVSPPDSIFAQVIDPASLRVEYYLDRVVEHYRSAGELAGGRTPAKFSVVLGLLQKWFDARKHRSAELKEAFENRSIPCGPEFAPRESNAEELRRLIQRQKSDATPLHLLSEVAMGDPNNRPGTATGYLPSSRPGSTYPSTVPGQPTSSSTDLVSPGQPLASGPSPGTTDTWPPYQPSSTTRPFYPAFGSTGTTPAAAAYQDVPTTGYPDLTGNLGMPGMNLGFFVPELGMQVGFNPDNLVALETMIGDGVLNLPLAADGSMGYYS